MEYNLKNIRQDFKDKGIFYTQKELALFMKNLIDIDIRDVYDPTFGGGNLLEVFPDELPKYGQELNDHQVEYAKARLNNFTAVCGDTLAEPAFLDKKFSCIMGNPPFSIKWNPPADKNSDVRFKDAPTIPTGSKADFAFLLHILHLLADDGIAVVINFPGVLYRGGRELELRKWMVEQNYIDKVIRIPGGHFIDTKIETVCIVFKKNKKNTDIAFIDSEDNISRIVPFDEVKQNDFTLSVSSYVSKEEEKEEIDIDELNRQLKETTERRIKRSLELDQFIAELEGVPEQFEAIPRDLEKIVKSYKTNSSKTKKQTNDGYTLGSLF